MPTVPSEPEKYSIDEMMDRLKSPSEDPDAGELVVRSDGTQALRVRKRKRRSNQPRKEELKRTRKALIMQVAAALVLVLAAALTVGTAIVYANSRPFRENLIEKIAQSSGAAVELEQFRMNPKTANSEKLMFGWQEGNALKSLSLRHLVAEIFPTTFMGKTISGEDVVAAEGILALQAPKPGRAPRVTPAVAGAQALNFKRYRISKFHLTAGKPTAPLIKLSNSEASLNPENIHGRPQLSLYRGDVTIAGWPKFRMDRALIEFGNNETEIIGLRLHQDQDERGSLEISGTVYPYQPDRASTLEVRLDAFELAGLTGPAMGRLISGRIDTLSTPEANFLSFRAGDSPAPTVQLAFRATPTSRIEIQGFPFLHSLSRMLDDIWFERPVFEGDADGVFHHENGIASLRELDMESKARMALRGSISVDPHGKLSGNLQLGIAESMIASLKDRRLDSLFERSSEGFLWTTLAISGSAASPADNFKDRLSAAAASAPPKSEPAAGPAAEGGSTFEELTRPR
ncbi:MAG: hypothetical protein WED15_06225 [Akkermansiaceae bacterium]